MDLGLLHSRKQVEMMNEHWGYGSGVWGEVREKFGLEVEI